jgi:hypothetical protein
MTHRVLKSTRRPFRLDFPPTTAARIVVWRDWMMERPVVRSERALLANAERFDLRSRSDRGKPTLRLRRLAAIKDRTATAAMAAAGGKVAKTVRRLETSRRMLRDHVPQRPRCQPANPAATSAEYGITMARVKNRGTKDNTQRYQRFVDFDGIGKNRPTHQLDINKATAEKFAADAEARGGPGETVNVRL